MARGRSIVRADRDGTPCRTQDPRGTTRSGTSSHRALSHRPTDTDPGTFDALPPPPSRPFDGNHSEEIVSNGIREGSSSIGRAVEQMDAADAGARQGTSLLMQVFDA